jgi:polyisoprenyl-phosphate glycosyltransferase
MSPHEKAGDQFLSRPISGLKAGQEPIIPSVVALTILVPVYNDWPAVALLIPALDRELLAAGRTAGLLIVDDGSVVPLRSTLAEIQVEAVTSVDVLHLRINLGHQRAIAIGVAYLEVEHPPRDIVIMDGDGEDRPEDVDRLLCAMERDSCTRIVFAERTRRSEGLVFSILYGFYRLLHRALTGERVRVGNFCVVPAGLLRRLVAVSHLWNHFAAAVFQARIPFTTIPTVRGRRYAGRSQMNFVALLTHGLSAMSVFGDRIGVRLLLVTCALTLAGASAAMAIVLWHLAAGAALPAWFPYAAVALVMLIFLALAISLAFVFIILSGRGTQGFLPFRDYSHYVGHLTSLAVSRPHVQPPVPRN